MKSIEFLEMTTKFAKDYVPNAAESIGRNSHMHNVNEDYAKSLSQDVVEAVLVDFINYMGMRNGVDYALNASDLKHTEDENKAKAQYACICATSELKAQFMITREEVHDGVQPFVPIKGALVKPQGDMVSLLGTLVMITDVEEGSGEVSSIWVEGSDAEWGCDKRDWIPATEDEIKAYFSVRSP